MSGLSAELLFAKSHEWVRRLDDNILEIGISDFAQNALGDVVYIELPEVGSMVSAQQECCAIESVKAASDIYAPASGEVIAVNEQLSDEPELLNESPFEQGWLFRMKFESNDDLNALLDESAYLAQVED